MYKPQKTKYETALKSLEEKMRTDRRLQKYERLYLDNKLKGFNNLCLVDKSLYTGGEFNKSVLFNENLIANEFELRESMREIVKELSDFNLKITRTKNSETITLTSLETGKTFLTKIRAIHNGKSDDDLDLDIICLLIKDKVTRLLVKPGFGSSIIKSIKKL
jgi:hypothetical protein